MQPYYDDNRSQSIKSFVRDRGIEYLVHFTRIENLDSILRYGIIPRANLYDYDIMANCNDSQRLDGYEDANCVSISFPNYKMFFSCRRKQKNSDNRWIILKLKVDILWKEECAFCKHNAASNEITYLDIEKLKSLNALKGMFSEMPSIQGSERRVDRGTKPEETTDPQAEVLVFNTIQPEDILEVVCFDIYTKQELKDRYHNRVITVDRELFQPRRDYTYW